MGGTLKTFVFISDLLEWMPKLDYLFQFNFYVIYLFQVVFPNDVSLFLFSALLEFNTYVIAVNSGIYHAVCHFTCLWVDSALLKFSAFKKHLD